MNWKSGANDFVRVLLRQTSSVKLSVFDALAIGSQLSAVSHQLSAISYQEEIKN